MESFQAAEQALIGMDLKYTKQILASLLPICLTVILHGVGIDQVHRFFKRFGRPVMRGPHQFARTAVLVGVVLILLLSHFFGIAVWAFFYLATDLLKDFSHAMLYSLNGYTTMGASNIYLPKGWQGFDNFEAMTGMLMFGWSTAVLADIINKLHNTED